MTSNHPPGPLLAVATALERCGTWLAFLWRYLAIIAVGNGLWETLQLPLYTIWREGTAREIALAVVHCTAGDVLIALGTLGLAWLIAGGRRWPPRRYRRIAGLTMLFGVAYTIFSEWLNVSVRQSWAYSNLMPVVPVIDTGLAPLLQWIAVPALGLWMVRSRTGSPPEA